MLATASNQVSPLCARPGDVSETLSSIQSWLELGLFHNDTDFAEEAFAAI